MHQNQEHSFSSLGSAQQEHLFWDGRHWLVSSHELICQIARDTTSFCSSPPRREQRSCRDGLRFGQALFLDGMPHHALRKVLEEALLTFLRPPRTVLTRMQTLGTSFVEEMLPRGRMDLVSDFALPLTDSILSTVLGLPLIQEDFRERSDAYADWTTGHRRDDIFQLIEEFRLQIEQLRDLRLACVGGQRESEDVLGYLLRERERIGDEETLLANLMMLGAAGRHATRNSLTEGVWLLLSQEGLWFRLHSALQKKPHLITSVLERIFCLSTPTSTLARWAKEYVSIGGKLIEPGQKVILMLEAANQEICSQIGQEMEELLYPLALAHLSFGPPRDPHYCPGARLARELLRHIFSALLIQIPTLQLVSQSPPVRAENKTIGGIISLPVCWEVSTKELGSLRLQSGGVHVTLS